MQLLGFSGWFATVTVHSKFKMLLQKV